jgi:hypothetical protein
VFTFLLGAWCVIDGACLPLQLDTSETAAAPPHPALRVPFSRMLACGQPGAGRRNAAPVGLPAWDSTVSVIEARAWPHPIEKADGRHSSGDDSSIVSVCERKSPTHVFESKWPDVLRCPHRKWTTCRLRACDGLRRPPWPGLADHLSTNVGRQGGCLALQTARWLHAIESII